MTKISNYNSIFNPTSKKKFSIVRPVKRKGVFLLHELSVAQNIVEQVKHLLHDKKVNAVSSLYLKVGALSGVDPHSLRFVFPEAARNSYLENSELFIEEVPLKIFCTKCKVERTIGDFLPYCPSCYSSDVHTLEGKELIIQKMEVT